MRVLGQKITWGAFGPFLGLRALLCSYNLLYLNNLEQKYIYPKYSFKSSNLDMGKNRTGVVANY